jgi:hypothetical protein
LKASWPIDVTEYVMPLFVTYFGMVMSPLYKGPLLLFTTSTVSSDVVE